MIKYHNTNEKYTSRLSPSNLFYCKEKKREKPPPPPPPQKKKKNFEVSSFPKLTG